MNLDGSFGLTVLQSVADEIGCYLREAVDVPFAGKIAVLLKLDAALRKSHLVFSHHPLHSFGQIGVAEFEGYATCKPRSGQIEHIVNHSAHASAALQNALRSAPHCLVLGLILNHMSSHEYGAQRISQVMPQDGGKHLIQVQSLGLFAQLLRKLLLLAVQSKEDLRLAL